MLSTSFLQRELSHSPSGCPTGGEGFVYAFREGKLSSESASALGLTDKK
jgi:hypothetical protein